MVAEPHEKAEITEENGGMRAYPLFPFDPARNLEVFYIEFDAGVRHDSLPHVAGVEEYILPVRGGIENGNQRERNSIAGKAVHTLQGGCSPRISQ